MAETFELTEEHVTLLHNAIVRWEDAETGAPCIDPKRPYGDRCVSLNVMEVLGWCIEWTDEEESEIDEDQEARALALHYETETALQIVLACGTFEPGPYKRVAFADWERV